ncbi:hypothetical protein STXM2123_1357 [Streptomyces sp. F-3]|nr:hypothetical protein STXM2123_1357 [Streptomyces sp. F-3]
MALTSAFRPRTLPADGSAAGSGAPCGRREEGGFAGVSQGGGEAAGEAARPGRGAAPGRCVSAGSPVSAGYS